MYVHGPQTRCMSGRSAKHNLQYLRHAQHEYLHFVLCVALRCATMRQDIISIFADVDDDLEIERSACLKHDFVLVLCKIQNMSQNTILSKSRLDASWRNATRRMKISSVFENL